MNLTKLNLNDIKITLKEQKSHWKMFFWVFLYSLIPSLWVLTRSIIITKYMSASVETYAQWEYLNIFLEIIQETTIFPLFWWFGKMAVNTKKDLDKVREIYIITFTIYFFIILIISFFVGNLVNVIGSDYGYKKKTFFVLQLWSKIPELLTSVSIVILLNTKNYLGFLVLLIIKLLISLTFDLTFANENVFSDSYIGLGLSSLLTQTILFLTSFIMVAKIFGFKSFFDLRSFTFNLKKWNFSKKFWSNVLSSFLFSFINNMFYLFLIAKNINLASQSDAYWLSNTIIWSWILMTSNVIFSINKSIVSTTENQNFKTTLIQIIEFQLISLSCILVMFAIFIPIYRPFALFISNNNEDLVDRSWNIFSKLITFFIFYVMGTSLISHFNGLGKNWFLAFQSLFSNILTFIPFIIMHSLGKLNYDIEVIALMFGISLFVTWIVAIIFTYFYLYNQFEKENKINSN